MSTVLTTPNASIERLHASRDRLALRHLAVAQAIDGAVCCSDRVTLMYESLIAMRFLIAVLR